MHALMQGMTLAVQHCDVPIIVQSDFSEALMTQTGDNLSRPAYGHLLAEIKHLMVDREFMIVVWLNHRSPCIEKLLPLDCNPIRME